MQSRFTPSRSKPQCGLYHTIVILLAALLSHSAAASVIVEGPGTSTFSFSGFGTLGLVHSGEHNADFTSDLTQPNGAGYTHSWSPDVDSRLGAQVSAQFTPQFSAMLQVISEQLYNNSYRPHVEWANISYEPTPEFGVRFGRIVLPTYLLSNTRKVGYSNPWVRPPVEFYGRSPLYDSDGADAHYKKNLGDAVNTLEGTYGSARFRVNGGAEFKVNRLWVIADTLEYGPLSLHVAYQASALTYQALDPLFDYIRLFGPQGMALADKYNTDDKQAQFLTAGAMYDPGKWFVTGEWEKRNLHSAFGQSSSWYVSGGYRLAKFTPYLIYAQTKVTSNTSDPGLDVTALPPEDVGLATFLNGVLNAELASIPVQNTISIGSRWDVMKNVDLKMQYDRMKLGSGSAGTLINTQAAFQPGGSVNLVSITIDFIW